MFFAGLVALALNTAALCTVPHLNCPTCLFAVCPPAASALVYRVRLRFSCTFPCQPIPLVSVLPANFRLFQDKP